MDDEKIMQALKICSGYGCVGCPMERAKNCRSTLTKEALKLIKKLKGEKQ